MARTLCVGLRALSGFWNTIWSRRRASPGRFPAGFYTSMPSNESPSDKRFRPSRNRPWYLGASAAARSRTSSVGRSSRTGCTSAADTRSVESWVAGENSRPGDMDVNGTKEKKLSNMRTTATDENVQLEPPRDITLEYGLEYIEEDELIEVTPANIRLRKRMLAAVDRKKAARAAARIADAS